MPLHKAELWEDKQKEAAYLIDILKLYTQEIIMTSVMSGRMTGPRWREKWDLFERMTAKHTELGQKLDFSELKRDLDSVFIFDICSRCAGLIQQDIQGGVAQANKLIAEKYGSPIQDIDGYGNDIEKLHGLRIITDDLLERSKNGNTARELLIDAKRARDLLKSSFDISIEFDKEAYSRLQTMEELVSKRPLTITPELISWSERA